MVQGSRVAIAIAPLPAPGALSPLPRLPATRPCWKPSPADLKILELSFCVIARGPSQTPPSRLCRKKPRGKGASGRGWGVPQSSIQAPDPSLCLGAPGPGLVRELFRRASTGPEAFPLGRTTWGLEARSAGSGARRTCRRRFPHRTPWLRSHTHRRRSEHPLGSAQ